MRDLQGLCDRLDEVFEMDDTPDGLSQEAKTAIEELWKERDHLKEWMQAIYDATKDPKAYAHNTWVHGAAKAGLQESEWTLSKAPETPGRRTSDD